MSAPGTPGRLGNPPAREASGADSARRAPPVFELERATVKYPGIDSAALEGATFSVTAGECVALVGPNGAGKTSALRAVLGLVELVGGTARVLGRPSREWRRDELARRVGVVAQREEPAFPITVAEAVAMGRYAHLGPWRDLGARDRGVTARAMLRADVSHLEHRWVQTLSGGEWQRVRLARALAQEPDALVLDEPTASLDLKHEMELFELMSGLVRRDRLAALVVSHHLNLAARFADRLVLIASGRVIADAPPLEVLQPDRLESVFGWPVAVHHLADGTPQVYPERRPASFNGEVS